MIIIQSRISFFKYVVCVCVYISLCMYVCISVLWVFVCSCACVCVCLYVCDYVCCAYVSACVSVSAYTCYGICGGLKRSCLNPFPPPTMCNSGIELRSTGLTASSFYTLSHLAGPSPELLQPSVTNSHLSLHSLSLDCHVHNQKGKKKGNIKMAKPYLGQET